MASFITPVLVGRSAELQQLDGALAAVQAGGGRCIRVSGEAGIGKSRLLAELRDRAVARNFAILAGRCFEQDTAIPYAPLVDLLRTHFAHRKPEDVVAALGPQAPDVARLLPELALRLVNQPATPEPEADKRRLFDALTTFLLRQTEAQPLLLTVEDLHWSDAASLEFLLFLVRRSAPYPLLLLLTYRSPEGQTGLAPLLTGLDREPIAASLPLKPLTRVDIAQMLRAILDQPRPPSAEFVAAVHRLTEGNPFFTEEILTSLIVSEDIYLIEGRWERKPLTQIDIPGSIQHVVEQRLSHLTQPARQLLDLAAVSGRSFDFTVLQALTGHGDRALLGLIKELMTAQLVVEESADQFAFRYTLTREALYNQLLGRERQTLHGQMAQAIEQIYAGAIDIRLEALAENFRRRATAMLPPAQPLTPRQTARQEFGGLTHRERQVAAVVTQGLSNQEIADELVVSVKTVEAHITRILSKLGFSSRAQIAAWAVDKGLASAPQNLDDLQ